MSDEPKRVGAQKAWHRETCGCCGEEFLYSRGEPKPVPLNFPVFCESCSEYERGFKDGVQSARDEAARQAEFAETMASTALNNELREARDRLQTVVDECIGSHPEMPVDELISEVEAALNTWRNRAIRAEDEERIAKRTLDAFAAVHWHPVGDDAHAAPFGTIRVCRACGCLVAGGPTACGRCVEKEMAK